MQSWPKKCRQHHSTNKKKHFSYTYNFLQKQPDNQAYICNSFNFIHFLAINLLFHGNDKQATIHTTCILRTQKYI